MTKSFREMAKGFKKMYPEAPVSSFIPDIEVGDEQHFLFSYDYVAEDLNSYEISVYREKLTKSQRLAIITITLEAEAKVVLIANRDQHIGIRILAVILTELIKLHPEISETELTILYAEQGHQDSANET